MRRHLLLTVGLVSFLSTGWSVTQAQNFISPRAAALWGANPYNGYGSYGGFGMNSIGWHNGYGSYGGFGYSGVATFPVIPYRGGVADVIRSRGEYNEATSRSYINYEQARKGYIENRKQWQQAYFDMRQSNEARRVRKLEGAKHSPEALAYAARSSAPRALSSESLDPITGRLLWPEILQRDEFAIQREQIEQQFEIRASTSGAETNLPAIEQSVGRMIEILRSEIEDLPVDQYMESRKFLDSLAYSARA